MKKKIMVVISINQYVRNYISTGAFSKIKDEYDVSYLISDDINPSLISDEKILISSYKLARKTQKAHYELFNVLMWRFQKKSTSFKFRTARELELNFTLFSPDYGIFQKWIRLIWRITRNLYLRLFILAVKNKFIFGLYFNWKKNNLKINADIYSTIDTYRPSLVLVPCSAYDPAGNDVVRVCQKLNIATLFLVDNWDNLSSKSILWAKPNYIGVWGEQSAEHAVSIQDFNREQVTCLGTPRFDQYFKTRDLNIESKFNFKYILFVGTALAFDEAGALENLNGIIERNIHLFNKVKIIYRPHPWRQSNDSIIGKNLEHVMIDPQIYSAYINNEKSDFFQPDLLYYPGLLKNAEFVVGGLTSMLIEALIFRKRFMALVYDDGKNITSQHNAFKYYTHFRGLLSIDAMSFCENIDELESVLIATWKLRNHVDAVKLDAQRRYFYFDDSRTYAERLLDLCRDITSKGATCILQQEDRNIRLC